MYFLSGLDTARWKRARRVAKMESRVGDASPFGLYFHCNVCEDAVDSGFERSPVGTPAFWQTRPLCD